MDGDAAASESSGGEDCDDDDATAYPGAVETWYDGVDQGCDGGDDDDADGDGHASDAHGGDDCDDGDNAVHPGAVDAWYDGTDSDCNGDDDYDADGDGFQSDTHGGTDCFDDNADAHPGQTAHFTVDRGDGGFDYDCDGAESAELLTTVGACTCDTGGGTYALDTEGWVNGDPGCGGAGYYLDGDEDCPDRLYNGFIGSYQQCSSYLVSSTTSTSGWPTVSTGTLALDATQACR